MYEIFDEKEGCPLVAYEVIDLLNELNDENKELRILVDSLKQQNKKFKGKLNDLGVEYYD